MVTHQARSGPHESAADDMESRLMAAERLLKLFQMERFAYLAATMLAITFLIVTAIVLILKESYPLAFGMFGSCGVITLTIGRLLRLWNQVFEAIQGEKKHDEH